MIMFFPYSVVFFTVLVFGTIFGVSSSHYLGVWFGFELNMLGFVCFSLSGGSFREIEALMKYFVVQSLGSGFWLLGSFFCYELVSGFFLLFGGVVGFFLLWGLLLKLGVFPLFFWIPSVMGGLGWGGCLLLSIWQKILPLVFLGVIGGGLGWLMFLGGVSGLVGGFGGLNQVLMRVLLAYSSIGHLGWMVCGMNISVIGGLIYFFVYSVVTMGIFLFLIYYDFFYIGQFGGGVIGGGYWKVIYGGLVFFSLGGVPPFLGFFGKMILIQLLCDGGFFFVLMMLIIGSLVNLYYYLVVVMNVCVGEVVGVKGGFELGFSFLGSFLVIFSFFSSFMFWGILSVGGLI